MMTSYLTKGVLFHHDHAPADKSLLSMASERVCGIELVDLSPYSPDFIIISSSTQKKKKNLAGDQYRSDDDIRSAFLDSFLTKRTYNSLIYKKKRL